MKPAVIIGYSACQLTREAFERAGCDAWTCDLLAPRGASDKHIQGDIWDALRSRKWDLGVFHPMCTFLNIASVWALKDADYGRYPGKGYHMQVKPGTLTGAARRAAQAEAFENFQRLLDLDILLGIENPAPSTLNRNVCPPSQVIQPYMFGDDASKGTGLWLKGLPPLVVPPQSEWVNPRIVTTATGKQAKRWANQTDSGQNRLTPSDNRWLERSATYPGIAAAMGKQWGEFLK